MMQVTFIIEALESTGWTLLVAMTGATLAMARAEEDRLSKAFGGVLTRIR